MNQSIESRANRIILDSQSIIMIESPTPDAGRAVESKHKTTTFDCANTYMYFTGLFAF